MSKNTIKEYTKNLTIDSLNTEKKTPILIDSNAIVEDLVSLLSEKKVLSVPVHDKKNKQIVGMVDCLDLTQHLLVVMPEKKDLIDVKALEQSYRAINLKKVSEIMNLSSRDPYEPVFMSDPVSVLVPIFASGVHRVATTDEKGDFKMLVSQSLVIKNILNFIEDDEVFGKKSLKDLGLGQVKPLSVHGTDPVLNALHIISKGYSGVPVIDKGGVLIGNFSASDVKNFVHDQLPSYTQEIKFWLEDHSPNSLKPVTVTLENTFAEVCQVLSKGLHRVWVVDKENKVAGVVSYTDIFKLIRDHN